jgi:hypothetical protein
MHESDSLILRVLKIGRQKKDDILLNLSTFNKISKIFWYPFAMNRIFID